MRYIRTAALLGAVALTITACSGSDGGSGGGSGEATGATGPITIWLSNNEQEVGWGQDVVDAWNADHPDEQVTAQEIPAGSSSEEAITAAITAGTAPCLVYNISSAAVPGWVRQGGLVDLTTFDGGADYLTERGGDGVSVYETDGGYYQLPWKSNPVMVMYNKALFAQAGLDPENPGMATFDEFLAGAQQIVDSGAAPSAIWPSPTNDFFQPWFDFYPVYLAETGGTALVEDGKATFDDEAGTAVADFWASIYADGLAPQEEATDDAMVSGQTAMQMAGPWAIASYKDSVDVGFMPVPTSDGREDVTTFADSKNVSMFTSCENQGTAWEFLKYSTSEESDGALLEATGQMPLRQDLAATYPDYFAAHPEYEVFADQAARTGDVPSIPNSIEVWQAFREAYTSAVIFQSTSVDDFLSTAASKIDDLVQG